MDQPITFKTSARARRLKISISTKGEVVVTSPPLFPKFMVKKFVADHQAWIESHLAKMRLKQPKSDQIQIFGQTYQLEVVTSDQKASQVKIIGTTVQVTVRPPATQAAISKAINAFLKSTAEQYLIPRTHQLAATMKTQFAAISLREQKTRWGSCSSRGNLQFNWRLVHHPPEVIDYVIIHELAHRSQMNHSAAFWAIVKKYDPAYLKHQGWLKRQGMHLS